MFTLKFLLSSFTVWCTNGNQSTTYGGLFSASTIWVPRIEVRSSELAASPLLAESPC